MTTTQRIDTNKNIAMAAEIFKAEARLREQTSFGISFRGEAEADAACEPLIAIDESMTTIINYRMAVGEALTQARKVRARARARVTDIQRRFAEMEEECF